MAGHSKWANIKHRKGAADAKRGKIFTKIIKDIMIAVKENNNPEPDSNPRLRLAIQNAKGANMPKDNIARAIKKASGAGGETYEEVTYEGYAPHGIAVFVECATDNTTRTVQNVRSYFNKYNGSLGKNGSLEFLFDRKGIFELEKPTDFDEDDFSLEAIDGGADEIEVEDDTVYVTTAMEDFGNFQAKLEEMGLEAKSAELRRIPTTTKLLDNESFQQVMKLIDKLDDDDDVQKVYHTLEVTEAQADLL